jgi:hypothetical protein
MIKPTKIYNRNKRGMYSRILIYVKKIYILKIVKAKCTKFMAEKVSSHVAGKHTHRKTHAFLNL